MELYYTVPIFLPRNTIAIENQSTVSELQLIGEGSYALVYSYHDNYYAKTFSLKRARNNLTPKEFERFEREYEQMKKLSSPYVIEVFGYNKENNEYTMEFMDCSLDDYIKANNTKLSFPERVSLGL